MIQYIDFENFVEVQIFCVHKKIISIETLKGTKTQIDVYDSYGQPWTYPYTYYRVWYNDEN